MPTFITCVCPNCESTFKKKLSDYNKTNKAGKRHFCSTSCAAKAGNKFRRSMPIVKVCEYCGKKFKSTTKKKAASHCSPSCASRASMTKKRRWAQRVSGKKHIVDALRKNEGWKYRLLEKELHGRPHQFEYQLGNAVFDLAILDRSVLVEFDGPSHGLKRQRARDNEKDLIAAKNSFDIVRVPVNHATVIPPKSINGL